MCHVWLVCWLAGRVLWTSWPLLLIIPFEMVCLTLNLGKHPLSSLQPTGNELLPQPQGFCLFENHISAFVWGHVRREAIFKQRVSQDTNIYSHPQASTFAWGHQAAFVHRSFQPVPRGALGAENLGMHKIDTDLLLSSIYHCDQINA